MNELDLKLVKVIDTHIHADHITGASKLKDITKCSTIMGDHTPADAVEIKVKDDEYINLENLKISKIHHKIKPAESMQDCGATQVGHCATQ